MRGAQGVGDTQQRTPHPTLQRVKTNARVVADKNNWRDGWRLRKHLWMPPTQNNGPHLHSRNASERFIPPARRSKQKLTSRLLPSLSMCVCVPPSRLESLQTRLARAPTGWSFESRWSNPPTIVQLAHLRRRKFFADLSRPSDGHFGHQISHKRSDWSQRHAATRPHWSRWQFNLPDIQSDFALSARACRMTVGRAAPTKCDIPVLRARNRASEQASSS